MSKKLINIVILAVLVFSIPIQNAHGATSNVIFDGKSDKYIKLSSNGDLFENFKKVFPGDVRTQDILIKNTSDKKILFYMDVEDSRKLNDGKDNLRKSAMEQMSLKMTYSSGLVRSSMFKDLTKNTSRFLLAELDSGETVSINLELEFLGDKMTNDMQNLDIYVDWVFDAEEIGTNIPIVPQTGQNYIILIGTILFVSGSGLLYIYSKRERMKGKNNDE